MALESKAEIICVQLLPAKKWFPGQHWVTQKHSLIKVIVQGGFKSLAQPAAF